MIGGGSSWLLNWIVLSKALSNSLIQTEVDGGVLENHILRVANSLYSDTHSQAHLHVGEVEEVVHVSGGCIFAVRDKNLWGKKGT